MTEEESKHAGDGLLTSSDVAQHAFNFGVASVRAKNLPESMCVIS